MFKKFKLLSILFWIFSFLKADEKYAFLIFSKENRHASFLVSKSAIKTSHFFNRINEKLQLKNNKKIKKDIFEKDTYLHMNRIFNNRFFTIQKLNRERKIYFYSEKEIKNAIKNNIKNSKNEGKDYFYNLQSSHISRVICKTSEEKNTICLRLNTIALDKEKKYIEIKFNTNIFEKKI